jgi:ABC-type glutathione transport system ATPase component
MALMYISHDLTVVGQMSDEIMVMYLGHGHGARQHG